MLVLALYRCRLFY